MLQIRFILVVITLLSYTSANRNHVCWKSTSQVKLHAPNWITFYEV